MLMNKKRSVKFLLWGILVMVLISGAVIWYVFSEKFDDTSKVRADYIVNSDSLLKEFSRSTDNANKKYTEKILEVSGVVSEVEPVDSVVNVKFVDNSTGNYLIFSFQDSEIAEAKSLTPGEPVVIRASCSGGVHSDILDLNFVSFKRAAIIKK